jgi:hypothetical protein
MVLAARAESTKSVDGAERNCGSLMSGSRATRDGSRRAVLA